MAMKVEAPEKSFLVLQVGGLGVGLAALPLEKVIAATKTSERNQVTPTIEEGGSRILRCMKLPGESLNEEPSGQMYLPILRTTSRLGTWNVRTMYQSGKTDQVAREFQAYKLDILGLSETRWLGMGQIRMRGGETVIYSGHEDEDSDHTEGVAFMLSRKAAGSLVRWEPLGSRIITATFRTNKKDINLTIINCYAPTNNKEEEEKEAFYSRLQVEVDKTRRKDIVILMGDLNAQVGSDNTGYEEVMGTQGIKTMNENGELFAEFCASNQLVIGGTIFPHKRIHKATWVAPNYNLGVENQIDHICVSRQFRKSLQDVKVYRGADVGSDHHLVIGKIKLKLKKGKFEQERRAKFDVRKMSSAAKREEFAVTIRNRFQVLCEEETEDSMESQWSKMKEVWKTSCEEVLGRREHQNKEWISEGTLDKIKERRKAKASLMASKTRTGKQAAQEKYGEIDRDIKRRARQDKRNFIEGLASDAEEAASRGNLSEVYNITRKLSRKFQPADRPIRDLSGKLLTSQEEQRGRWREHFESLLNRHPPDNPPSIEPAEEDLEVSIEPPSKAEIRNAIKRIKNNKAAGPDEIPGEALKGSLESSINILHSLFRRIWESEEFPQDWKEGHIIKLPKKGNLQECGNHRGIMLLSVPGKVFNRVILERLKDAMDPIMRDEQAGFRKGRSCTDQIAALRIIVEQSLEWNSSLYINFIDYEKAFDSVDRDSLWKLLRHYGVPQKITNLIQKMYEGMTGKVVHAGELSEPFEIKTGVRQGCLLSPFLFLIAIDYIMREATRGRKNGIQWSLSKQLDDLDFADDIALLSHNHRQMQQKTDIIEDISRNIGLKINRGKSKILRVKSKGTEPITVRGEPLEDVNSFCYLGSIVNKEGGVDEDVRTRIQKARQAFVGLKYVWASKQISERTKIRLFNSNVKAVLMYGSETWRTTKATLKKLQAFANRCLRRIVGVHWPNTISNSNLYERTGQQTVEQQLKKRRWRWIGHTLRKPTGSISHSCLKWNPQGHRSRGRPRITWRREVEAEMGRVKKGWGDLKTLAGDRSEWRSFVDGLCSTGS